MFRFAHAASNNRMQPGGYVMENLHSVFPEGCCIEELREFPCNLPNDDLNYLRQRAHSDNAYFRSRMPWLMHREVTDSCDNAQCLNVFDPSGSEFMMSRLYLSVHRTLSRQDKCLSTKDKRRVMHNKESSLVSFDRPARKK